MAFILPRGAEREYLTAYGVVAVYVAKMPTGNAMAGISRDLLQSLISIRRRHVGAAIVAAYWAKDAGDAQLIRDEIERNSDGVLMTARTLQARIELAAARANVLLTSAWRSTTSRARSPKRRPPASCDGSIRPIRHGGSRPRRKVA
jgi:hypothetical protein